MEDTEKPKPDPAPVQLALKRLGINGVSDTNGSRSDAIYMFGDTVDDVRASTRAGIVAVGVDCQRAQTTTHALCVCWCRCYTRRWYGRVKCF